MVTSQNRLAKTGKIKKYRIIDVYARAMADACTIMPPEAKKLEIEISSLENDVERLRHQKEKLKNLIQNDEKHLAFVRKQKDLHEVFSKASVGLTGKTLLTEEEICEHAIEYKRMCGVYFLIKEKKVVYVGQSVSVFSRINAHITDKDFDSYAFVLCDKNRLDALESIYIHLFKPALNGTFPHTGIPVAPMNIETLLGTIGRYTEKTT